MIEAIYAAYGILALLLFRFLAPWRAVAITCFAGWLTLPVGNFPAGSGTAVFAYGIIGTALPSNMLLNKMWWPPVVALAGAVWRDRRTFVQCRPRWVDVPIILWCLWPIMQPPFVENPEPQPWISSLYLGATWGTPWLLGRVYFWGDEGAKRLISSMVTGLAVLVPIALLEGAFGPLVYASLYGPHPFRFDGAQRYVGFRPLGFFEDGNQYGIWVAAIAIAAIGLWQSAPELVKSGRLAAIAALGLIVAFMSQSLGAILLLCAGLILLLKLRSSFMRWALPLSCLLFVFAGALYLSGKVPMRAIAEKTAIGRHMTDIIRSSGRGSLAWRIARDQNALPLVAAHPFTGAGQWDWWRKNNERPWGLALLIVGQFGLIGLVLAFGSLLAPALRTLSSKQHCSDRKFSPTVALAVIVLMASADALLNSFFFYPAILAGGALAHRYRPVPGMSRNVR
jgi:hypothetical protein